MLVDPPAVTPIPPGAPIPAAAEDNVRPVEEGEPDCGCCCCCCWLSTRCFCCCSGLPTYAEEVFCPSTNSEDEEDEEDPPPLPPRPTDEDDDEGGE